jgi:alkylhydroperoxidase/carboxymuconolactone decarboxylase family protein YurZ
MNAVLAPRTSATTGWSRGPLVAAALDPLNAVVVVCGILILVLCQYALFAPLLVLADALAVGVYVAIPSRRALVLREARRKRRITQSQKLRSVDRAHYVELEETVRSAEPALSPRVRHETERLLDMFVDGGIQAARYEAVIERFARLPAETPDLATLVEARRRRRAAAARALESLTQQLTTISSLIQLGCEDAIATRAQAVAASCGAELDDAGTVAQLALATPEALIVDGEEVAPAS